MWALDGKQVAASAEQLAIGVLCVNMPDISATFFFLHLDDNDEQSSTLRCLVQDIHAPHHACL